MTVPDLRLGESRWPLSPVPWGDGVLLRLPGHWVRFKAGCSHPGYLARSLSLQEADELADSSLDVVRFLQPLFNCKQL